MGREILVNVFNMGTVGHQAPGLWKHPRDRSRGYKDLASWIELARTLERGLIDGLFVADVLGVYDVYGSSPATALRAGAQVPLIDPMLIVSAMAAVTEHLGFGVTCNLGSEPPYLLARRMSTLDHLTKGRMGWNIVTGYLDSAARGLGLERQTGHDRRYDQAEDYMQAVYKLWEGSWEDDAVVLDREQRMFTDPAKVHRVRHAGEFYKVDAIHLCEPSPQRTPVLYQAGASGRGRRFAASHAECVFINGPTAKVVGQYVSALRREAVAAGRKGSDVRVFSMATVVVDRTEEAASEKLADYRRYVDHEGTLALMSGWTGIDFSKYRLDDVLEHVQTEAMRTAVDNFTSSSSDRRWTIRDIAEFGAIGGRGPVFVGSPQTVADQLEEWVAATDVDGFNLAYAVYPETFADFIDLVIPELQRRGRYKTAYRSGTLREKLFETGRPRLTAPHPAAAYRTRAH
jgi:FMN-dependent oxidoreductase (nitrilotriacetate monooxygenase family)